MFGNADENNAIQGRFVNLVVGLSMTYLGYKAFDSLYSPKRSRTRRAKFRRTSSRKMQRAVRRSRESKRLTGEQKDAVAVLMTLDGVPKREAEQRIFKALKYAPLNLSAAELATLALKRDDLVKKNPRRQTQKRRQR